MTVYLWHFVPVIVIAVAFYGTGVMPQPAIRTAQWWELRRAWFALLTVVLVPLMAVVMRAERPMRRLPAGIGPPGVWSPLLLAAGLGTSMFGLARLAIARFAPGGQLPTLALAVCAAGLAATLLTGRAPAAGVKPGALRRSNRASRRKWPESPARCPQWPEPASHGITSRTGPRGGLQVQVGRFERDVLDAGGGVPELPGQVRQRSGGGVLSSSRSRIRVNRVLPTPCGGPRASSGQPGQGVAW
jgi:hypothetical protein